MNFEHVLSEAQARIDSTPDLAALDQVRVAYLGKSGSITALLKELGGLAPEERKLRGAEVNRLRNALSQALTLRKVSQRARSPGCSTTSQGHALRLRRGGLHSAPSTAGFSTG